MLLTGETGTGKDLAAKALHYNSDRASRAFVNITCSALPEQLLESELRSRTRGVHRRQTAETRAAGDGRWRDGVSRRDREMTPGLQAKLLRFLEEKTFKRVGGLADGTR